MTSSMQIRALEQDPSRDQSLFIGGISKKNDYLEHMDLEVKKSTLKSESIPSENLESILKS
jgi:hypothetical protein